VAWLRPAWLLALLGSSAVHLVFAERSYALPDVAALASRRAGLVPCIRAEAGDTLQVFGSDPAIYLDTALGPACRFLEAGLIFRDYTGRPLPPSRRAWRAEYLACVAEEPTWVVVDPALEAVLEPADRAGWAETLGHFEERGSCGGYRVFHR
jgi:hypothetical protein